MSKLLCCPGYFFHFLLKMKKTNALVLLVFTLTNIMFFPVFSCVRFISVFISLTILTFVLYVS